MSGKHYPDELKIEVVKQVTGRGFSMGVVCSGDLHLPFELFSAAPHPSLRALDEHTSSNIRMVSLEEVH